MKKEIADLWTDALRSGKYKQGRDVLTNLTDGTDCCLGVLCKLATEHGVEVEVKERTAVTPQNTKAIKCISYEGLFNMPPKAVTQWSGMTSDGKRLSSMNDHRETFQQIAKYIEENWQNI